MFTMISAIGIWFGKGAALGGLAASISAALFGLLRFALPPLLAYVSWRLFTGGGNPSPERTRTTVGITMMTVAVFALFHVMRHDLGAEASANELSSAGGWLGLLIGEPFRALLGTWGTFLVFVVVLYAGILVATHTTVAEVRDWFERFVDFVEETFAGTTRFDEEAEVDEVEGADTDDDELEVWNADGWSDIDDAPADDPWADAAPIADLDEDDDGGNIDLTGGRTDSGADHEEGLAEKGGRLLGRLVGVHPTSAPRPQDSAVAPEAAPAAAAAAVAPGATAWPTEVFDQDTSDQDATGAMPAAAMPATGDEPVVEQLQMVASDSAPESVERRKNWRLPPRKMLDRGEAQRYDAKAVNEAGRTLVNALREHNVETRLVGKVVGPTVTRFELELAPGVRVKQVIGHEKDIAYAMASPDVRILAPVPGKQAIGVEVPNVRREVVRLGDILASSEAREAEHPLEVAIGRDIKGISVMENLAQLPHLLIAGATGAGKSSCINSLITSLLMRSTPNQVRMILVDPKRVELTQYDRIPHLLTQVVTDPKKAANALAWAVKEMERRYDLLSSVGVRDITGYNEAFDRGDLNTDPETPPSYQRLPFILVVVDELADLMMVAARDVEDSICRLAQMARAVGIHLVIATQRPSTNVITGVIKANIPARLAFQVSSMIDSRVVLDQPGAERLVGKGDMLLLGPTSSIARRIQGAWVTEDEVREVVGHWRSLSPDIEFDESVVDELNAAGAAGAAAGGRGGGGSGSNAGDDDDLLDEALRLIVDSQLGSTSMLQRKLRVGFARAGRLMDLLEQRGVVGPSTGSKAREVLITPEELDGGSAEPAPGGAAAPAAPMGDPAAPAPVQAPEAPHPEAFADASAPLQDPSV